MMFNEITKKLRGNSHLIILTLIIIIALFFRTYKIIDWFGFDHDGDLYSWMVKDIVVDHHLRLIGQETSAPGIFIGPLFYYTLIPFFLLFKMDPIGAVIPLTAVGIITVVSYYIVFSKLFNKKTGLIASFLYGILLANVYFDRRIVPSTPTNLWLIWYFYTVMMLARGKYLVLPLLGFLVGLIWHIHIALAPALLAAFLAIVLSKKIPSIKQIFISLVAFIIPSIPLIIFEARHGFSQTLNFIQNFTVNHGGGKGIEKLDLLMIKFSQEIDRLFLYPQGFQANQVIFVIAILLSAIFLIKRRLLSKKEVIIFYSWIAGVFLFYTFSSTIVSEYYFVNVEIIFLTIISLLLYLLYRLSSWGKYLVVLLLIIILTKNMAYFTRVDIYKKGYNERKHVAKFITEDAKSKNFPCVSISYITSPGEDVGFRYFFWLNNLKVTTVQEDSATYTIVNPPELANGQKEEQFGKIKVIVPDKIPTQAQIKKGCSGQNTNLTDPLFGFTR